MENRKVNKIKADIEKVRHSHESPGPEHDPETDGPEEDGA